MDKIPYMPELESVEYSNDDYRTESYSEKFRNVISLIIIVILVILYILNIATIKYAILFLFLFASNLIYVLVVKNYKSTNADGILSESFRRSEFIKWNDITKVITKDEKQKIVYILESTNSFIKINENANNLKLIASIWQHLNQHGKSDDMIISEKLSECLEPIPDDIPEKFIWVDKSKYKIHNTLAGKILLSLGKILGNIFVYSFTYFLVNIITYILKIKKVDYSIFLILAVMSAIFDLVRYFSYKRVEIEANMLHLVIFRKVFNINLSDMKKAFWEDDRLYLEDNNKKKILIPYRPADPASKTLILAILRQLRKSPSYAFLPLLDESSYLSERIIVRED